MSDRYLASPPTAVPSKLSLYGRASLASAGLVAVPLPAPLTVLTVYTYPGCRVSEYAPPDGVTSAVCTNQSAEELEARLVAHTCTAPVGRPPRTLTFTVCAAVAVVVS